MEHKISNELPPIPGQPNGEAFHTDALPESVSRTEGQLVRATETNTSQQQPAPPPATQLPLQNSTAPQDQPVTDFPVTPQIADDNDLIEKEWVVKAREIVERTRHDPFVQNQEVGRFKADYIKKRYNKDIKVTED